jgi:hypothetical protein
MPKVVGFDPKTVKQATCQECGAINEYVPKDVRTLWSGTDYGGGPDGAKGFTCANCGKDVITYRW